MKGLKKEVRRVEKRRVKEEERVRKKGGEVEVKKEVREGVKSKRELKGSKVRES